MPEISSTCPYCGVGCGVSVNVDAQTDKALVRASQTHPANFGRLCSKGSALGETLLGVKEAKRLTHPQIGGAVTTWDDATTTIARKIQNSIEQHGRDSVAFYLSGQLLTEDYYVANKLMKGFIGSANVDTNSRLCMSSAVAAYKRAFGSDTVPCSYEDLEVADLIVLIGSNAAWTHPVLYQRIAAAKETNPDLRVVLIDPRRTASDDLADLHLPLAPSSDGFLFQGLLNYLLEQNALDQPYIDQYTEGFEAVKEGAKQLSLAEVLSKTALSEKALLTFYQWFAETRKTVSFYSQGVNQSATGTDKCNAIINCHLATGKIGYAGAGPFSITGQPNAMGGREVGGLANQLAAHMDFAPLDSDRVQRFWSSPTIAKQPGLKAVDLFDAVHDGQIKVLWIMATNPAVSLPDSNKVRRALESCETVIVSDVTQTDTTKYADILLPALGWSEKDGTVTNSERRISRQRAFCKAPGMAKADWWALSEVGKKLGYERFFGYQTPRDIFVEHARLSAFENNASRDFDISGLSELTQDEYDALVPVQWPVNQANPTGTERMFEDGRFFTPSGRARFISAASVLADCTKSELVLNTGRLRDQWHTMTRTGTAPSLTGHDDVPFVQIHPKDAQRYELQQNHFAELFNDYGTFVARVEITDSVTPDQLFSPIHWTEEFASKAVVSKLVSPEVDAVSGQPESKASAVSIRKFDCRQWARIASNERISKHGWRYWAETKTNNGFVTLLGLDKVLDWRQWALANLKYKASITQYANPITQADSLLISGNGKLELLIFANHDVAALPSFIWLDNARSKSIEQSSELLRGELGEYDQLICACFRSSRKTITDAIASTTQALLASNLGCGSKCGSCKPELAELLKRSNSFHIGKG